VFHAEDDVFRFGDLLDFLTGDSDGGVEESDKSGPHLILLGKGFCFS
jgi:hypothetical protein